MKIIIIDDDASFAKLLERRLRVFLPEMALQYAKNLAEARKLMSEPDQRPDLVIIDEHLPDGRGADFIGEGWFREIAVLSVSSDEAPEIPGSALGAGATYFLGKRSISEPLFKPLVQGVLERNRLQREVSDLKVKTAVMDSIKTLLHTLKHEINNPLGAVLGGAFLMRQLPGATDEQKEAANLVENSGKRIKHVLDQLSEAVEMSAGLETVSKASQVVYHVPGDAPWEQSNPKNPPKKN